MSGVPDYALEETIDFKFTSRQFSDGVPTTLAGTPAVEIYEDNSLTQITAAETLTVDFDGVTGLNNLRVVATAANGFEAGKSYHCVISAGTVGGTSVVGEVVAQFSIQRSPVNWAQVTAPTTAVDLSATDIQLCDTVTTNTDLVTAASIADAVWDETQSTHTTGGTFGELATEVAAILVDTASLNDTKIPQTLNLTASGNIGIDWANVENPTSIVDLAATDIQLVDTCTTNTDMVSAAPTAAAVADAVWDETQSTHTTAGTFGELATEVAAILVDTATLGAPAGASHAADIAAIKAETALIVADTNALQTDWADGGRLDLIVDAILVDTGTTIPGTITTAQADLDTITGTDGVTLATTQANYAPATAAALTTAQNDLDTLTGTNGALIATGQTAAAWSSLEASAGQITECIVDTVTNTHTPTTTVFQSDTITEATADHYNGRIVIFTSGVLAGQATDITDYEAVGGIGQFTVTAMTEAPSNDDTFIIV